MSLTHNEGKGH
uniref:Uncharacterized protein n=1 Tax=Anguilla anguilla TaxID=7936 RepID=A0A0E9XZD6_ANGAN